MRYVLILLFIVFKVLCDTWAKVPLSNARNLCAIASQKDIAVIVGGIEKNYSDCIDVYNSTSDTWTTSSLAGGSHIQLYAVALQGSFMIGTGYNEGGATHWLDFYNISTNTCNKIYTTSTNWIKIASGGNSTIIIPQTINYTIYNTLTSDFTDSNQACSRDIGGAITIGSLALFAGGMYNNGTYSSQVDIYNFRSNKWKSASLSVPRSNFAMTTLYISI